MDLYLQQRKNVVCTTIPMSWRSAILLESMTPCTRAEPGFEHRGGRSNRQSTIMCEEIRTRPKYIVVELEIFIQKTIVFLFYTDKKPFALR